MEISDMAGRPHSNTTLTASVLLSTVVVFAGDIITPLGYAEVMLYVLPLLLGSFLLHPQLPLRLAGASTVLIAAGFVLSPPGAPIAYALLNRPLAIIILWTTAFGLRRLIQDRIAHFQAERRGQLLAHQTHDILWDWDLLTNAHWWSKNAIDNFGYDPAHEPSINAWQSRLHPQDRSRVLTSIHAAIEQGQSGWTDEYQFRMQDDSYRDFLDRGRIIQDASGAAIRMIGAMIDVTARKQSAAALGDHAGDNVTYTLADTPCARVLGDQFCYCPDNVQNLFPRDHRLRTMDAVSYMGMPLFGSSGQPLGLLAVLDTKPLGPRLPRSPISLPSASKRSAPIAPAFWRN